MARLAFKTVMDHTMIPKSQRSHIASLIRRTITLENKLEDPGSWSEYFRWGILSQIENYQSLLKEYNSLVDRYNALSPEKLREGILQMTNFINEKVPQINPLFARSMIYHSTVWKINRDRDQLEWKTFVDKLPPWNDIRTYDHIIQKAFEAS